MVRFLLVLELHENLKVDFIENYTFPWHGVLYMAKQVKVKVKFLSKVIFEQMSSYCILCLCVSKLTCVLEKFCCLAEKNLINSAEFFLKEHKSFSRPQLC